MIWWWIRSDQESIEMTFFLFIFILSSFFTLHKPLQLSNPNFYNTFKPCWQSSLVQLRYTFLNIYSVILICKECRFSVDLLLSVCAQKNICVNELCNKSLSVFFRLSLIYNLDFEISIPLKQSRKKRSIHRKRATYKEKYV